MGQTPIRGLPGLCQWFLLAFCTQLNAAFSDNLDDVEGEMLGYLRELSQ